MSFISNIKSQVIKQKFMQNHDHHNQNLDFDSEEEGQLSLDVYHTADDVIIKAPIAGVSLEDINITIADGVLTIRGKRNKEEEIPVDNYYLQECYWGSFSRSVMLPHDLRTEEIKAFFKHGVLKITIPKDEKIKIKTIPINNSIQRP
jgi:HSP20 family protein